MPSSTAMLLAHVSTELVSPWQAMASLDAKVFTTLGWLKSSKQCACALEVSLPRRLVENTVLELNYCAQATMRWCASFVITIATTVWIEKAKFT